MRPKRKFQVNRSCVQRIIETEKILELSRGLIFLKTNETHETEECTLLIGSSQMYKGKKSIETSLISRLSN